MMRRAIICGGDDIGANDVEFIQSVVKGGFHVNVIQSSVVHEKLNGVPHAFIDTPEQIAELFAEPVELVVALRPIGDNTWSTACHSFVRSAALSYEKVAVVVQSSEYRLVQDAITADGHLALSLEQRKMLAEKAFRSLSDMDAEFANRLAYSHGKFGRINGSFPALTRL